MTFSIGLRFYKIQVSEKKRGGRPIRINKDDMTLDPFVFLQEFVQQRSVPTEETVSPRTWFFEEQEFSGIRGIHGLINYGTHGFESKIIDVKSKEQKYQRIATDLEQIPLYFQYWIPDKSDFGLAAYQSFQGRSCINFIHTAATHAFENRKNAHKISFRILAPGDIGNDVIASSPVKTVTFIKRRLPADLADKYLGGNSTEEVEYEVQLKSKRKKNLGLFKDVIKGAEAHQKNGVFILDDLAFDQVKADVDVNGKRRVFGIFGSGADSGLIDVTGQVAMKADGHPNFESISAEVDEWMDLFYNELCNED